MPTSRVIIVLYAFIATANVMASRAGHASLEWATKPLLMPLLAGVVAFAAHEAGRRPSRTLLAALGFATAGDVALMVDGTLPFLIGMAAFLGCQAFLIISFVRAKARPLPWVALLYGVGFAVAVGSLWSGLGSLALPVTLYAVALTTMATLAAGLGWRIGLGGLLFFTSDLLLAVDLADVVHTGPWVMLTYVVGLALIVTGWITRPAPPSIPQPRPASDPAAAPAPVPRA